jgi:hypothetical protein
MTTPVEVSVAEYLTYTAAPRSREDAIALLARHPDMRNRVYRVLEEGPLTPARVQRLIAEAIIEQVDCDLAHAGEGIEVRP